MNRVIVVIPMFGKEEYTNRCIDFCRANAGVPHDILVVDDGSPELFMHPGVFVHRINENSGFTNAANEGLLWALRGQYEFVHLLNNDTEPHENFLVPLVEILNSQPKVAIASSVRFYPTDNMYELYGIDLIRGYQAVIKPEFLKEETLQCNWVPLCSSLIRLDAVRYLGLLDRRMRTHSSDLDYCVRAKIHGYDIVVDTRSKVMHHHEITTKAHSITPEKDQAALLEKLACLHYAQFLNALPLDAHAKTYGKLEFTVYQKS